MTSTARVEANQKNAQKSTGPRTLADKERSKMNGLKHGLRAEEAALPTESRAEFDDHAYHCRSGGQSADRTQARGGRSCSWPKA